MKTLACALVLSLAATPLYARDGNWQVGNDKIHIVDSTINVATKAGRMRLLEHVERAAARLCRDRTGGARRQCEVDTVRQTVRTQGDWGHALALAQQERSSVQSAAR